MPNHVTVVGLGVGDYSLREDFDYSVLDGRNLCEDVLPLPRELQDIVATTPPARYRHKVTRQWHQSVNSPTEHRDDYERVELTSEEMFHLTCKYGAATWWDWCCENWGTKWGTYRTKTTECDGDNTPMLIQFQCAWNPPKPKVMKLINEYIHSKVGVHRMKWMAYDPGDGMTHDVEVDN